MKRRLTTRLVAILSVLSLAVALCGCAGDKEGGSKNSITIGIPQDIEETLDPHNMVAAGTKEIFFNVFEGLVKPDSDGNIVPAVASEITVSDDGLTYTFTIREGVKFHDGTVVTAEDVQYSMSKCADIEGKNPMIPALLNVKSVDVVDDSHVAVTLESPDNDFLANIATVSAAIIPAHNANPAGEAIGTGPYKYVSRSPLENVIFEKNDDYWGEAASIKNVTFKVCANADTIPMELEGGSIDMMAHLTNAIKIQINTEKFEVLSGTMNLVQALYLNHSYEPFANEDVRKAMCYAVDKDGILNFVSDGEGVKIGSSMYPNFRKYYDDSLADAYPHDVEKAKELLKKAGYENGFSFDITVPSNYTQHVDTATVIKEQLAEVGITANIKQVDWDTWLNDTYIGRNYDATVIGVDAAQLTASALLARFVSDAGNNFTNYNNPAYDKLYNEAFANRDADAQTAQFKECVKMLSDDAANVYVQDLPEFVALNKKFTGYTFYPVYVIDVAKIRLAE
ncbi:MAG: ABC transporter substrate-binding protein [Lachnospiraceae bacterium]|nr:ABC transporter substrate-binding protein [Lachnospiraceae bacterium]